MCANLSISSRISPSASAAIIVESVEARRILDITYRPGAVR